MITFSVVFHTLALWLGYVMLAMLAVLFCLVGLALWCERFAVNDGMSDATMLQLMKEMDDETSN